MQSIEVTPASAHIAAGTSIKLTATAIFSDASRQDITTQVMWASSNTTTATVSNAAGSNGTAVAATAGNTTVSATQDGHTGQATFTVTPAVLVSIETAPPIVAIAKGTTAQFVATGVFSDKSTQNLTAQVAWVSSNPDVAAISNSAGSNGRASATTVGNTAISASLSGTVSTPVALTVTAAALTEIQITPPNLTLANGLSKQLVATGVYSDGSTQNLTSEVTWASSSSGVASVSNAAGSNGLASALAPGGANLSASLGNVTSANVPLSVSAATLVAIQITPPSFSLPSGLTEQFVATGVYTDSSTQDLTAAATWSSSDGAVAAISNASGSNGLASGLGVGGAHIVASTGSVTSPSVTLTVSAATLVALQVSPPSPAIANGLKEQFTAIGVYTDNSTQNLTSAVTWASSNSGVASISNAAGSNGMASALIPGTTDVSASFGGVTSPIATLSISAAALVSIQVTVTNPGIANGLTEQVTALGTFTDGSIQDLTSAVTWASSNPAVASVSNASGANGRVSALALGATDISASLGSVTSPSSTLDVSAATLVSLQITPPAATVAQASSQQFVATGLYTDGTQADLTSAVTWFSSSMGVASVSNASGSNGLVSAGAAGTTDISASFGGATSPSASLTVAPSFAGVWTYSDTSGNQGVLIMDNSGQLTSFGLQGGAWYGYNGSVAAVGNTASGTLTFVSSGSCESCASQDGSGYQPTASVVVTVAADAQTIVFADATHNQGWTYSHLPASSSQPMSTPAGAQASWTALVSGAEASYPHYAGWGNPYPVSAVGNGGLGNCLNSGTITPDIPALGIYILTCSQAYDAVNGIGVFNPSTAVVASGLVFMNTSGQIFGAFSDPGMFENVSYPAGAFP